MIIGKILYNIRNDSGLKQKYIAKRIGISPSALSRIETGDRKLTTDIFMKYCNALNITPVKIVKYLKNRISGEIPAEIYFAVEDLELIIDSLFNIKDDN